MQHKWTKFREEDWRYWYKIANTTGLVTTTVSNTKTVSWEHNARY